MENKNTTQNTTQLPFNKRHRRKVSDLENLILETLKMSDYSLTTSRIGQKINASYATTKKRLTKLEFDDRVERLKMGAGGHRSYWKVKR